LRLKIKLKKKLDEQQKLHKFHADKNGGSKPTAQNKISRTTQGSGECDKA